MISVETILTLRWIGAGYVFARDSYNEDDGLTPVGKVICAVVIAVIAPVVVGATIARAIVRSKRGGVKP